MTNFCRRRVASSRSSLFYLCKMFFNPLSLSLVVEEYEKLCEDLKLIF